MDEIVNLDELEPLARTRLDSAAYDYYAGGSGDEVTLRANRAAWADITLRHRALVDVSRRDTSTTVLGQRVAFPALVAPTAFQRLACADGECATARAAAAAGTVMILSSLSNVPVEEVVAAAKDAIWFQLYVMKDRGITRELVGRVTRAGCKALVLTVDAPLLGRRERDVRRAFALPPGLTIANIAQSLPTGVKDSGLALWFASQLDASLTWKDVEWLRSITDLPMVVKGIVRGDDAARAVACGAAGVVVSNHGGRQLDGAPATARVLPEIVDSVAGRAEVFVDGGVRRGVDVVRALAMGARAVLLGRPMLWALAAGGQAGVSRALELFRAEIDLAMALCGCPDVSAITPDLLHP
jgi:4-hydroxymandelate oxidase